MNELLERLKDFSTPELCDGAGLYHSMDYRIKPQACYEKIVGTALTVDVPSGEGSIVADAILHLEPGDILVVGGHGNCDCSYWGDHRSICAKLMGAAGVIIDGAFRDVEGCQAAGLPVYAKGLTCGTAGKSGAGAIQVPICCGGVVVHPGDIIVADANGVCVLKPEECKTTMEKALEKRKAQERVIQEMMRTGVVNPKVKTSK